LRHQQHPKDPHSFRYRNTQNSHQHKQQQRHLLTLAPHLCLLLFLRLQQLPLHLHRLCPRLPCPLLRPRQVPPQPRHHLTQPRALHPPRVPLTQRRAHLRLQAL
ncbi:unnamed protein product, partial [Closterium sp. NIES-53]